MNTLGTIGRIISLRYMTAEELGTKGDLLELVLSCMTGGQKKADEAYPPSFVLKVPIWGNYAASLKDRAVVGMMCAVFGALDVPEAYQKDGTIKVTLKMQSNPNIRLLAVGEENEAPGASSARQSTQPTGKTAAKGKTAAPASDPFEITEEEASSFDLPETVFSLDDDDSAFD